MGEVMARNRDMAEIRLKSLSHLETGRKFSSSTRLPSGTLVGTGGESRPFGQIVCLCRVLGGPWNRANDKYRGFRSFVAVCWTRKSSDPFWGRLSMMRLRSECMARTILQRQSVGTARAKGAHATSSQRPGHVA